MLEFEIVTGICEFVGAQRSISKIYYYDKNDQIQTKKQCCYSTHCAFQKYNCICIDSSTGMWPFKPEHVISRRYNSTIYQNEKCPRGHGKVEFAENVYLVTMSNNRKTWNSDKAVCLCTPSCFDPCRYNKPEAFS